MKIYKSLEEYSRALSTGEIPYPQSAVTLGKFDGVHLGHQKLLWEIKKAAKTGLTSVVFAINIKKDGILSHEERADFLEKSGIDVLIEYPFSDAFMRLSPHQFVRDILSKGLKAAYLAVGTDYHFGYQRSGDTAFLMDAQKEYGFTVDVVSKESYDGKVISSSRIRQALELADMELVEKLLGRPYPLKGEVVHGNHIGTGLGMPTANVYPQENKILPPRGVYATLTCLEDGRQIKGSTNIGFKPTVGSDRPVSETNLFDFDEDIYGTVIHTDFLSFIRPERRFASLDELKEQVNKDRAATAAFFEKTRLK